MEIINTKWEGKNVTKILDGTYNCLSLSGKDSLVCVPVSVKENCKYEVVIEVKKQNGDGVFFCNIYGSKNFDFPQVRVVCNNNEWGFYEFSVTTKDFPYGLPFVLRFFRPNQNGTILINNFFIIENNIDDVRTETNIVTDCTKDAIKVPAPVNNTIKCLKSAGNLEYFIPKPPKVLPIETGEDGIKLSVVISTYNRISLLDKSLYTYSKQTMKKDEFEIIIIDDNSTDDIISVCKKYSNLRFQYIKIDKTKGSIPPLSFNQALTNNIGFKNARGKVIVITGPETLQKENNLLISWESANKGFCVYGDIYRSSNNFTNFLNNKEWKNLDFNSLLSVPGAISEKDHLTGFWWYYVAVRKEHILNINGVDERYMKGITAEDDDFAFRMYESGVPLIRNHDIIGIHQDHSAEDKGDLHSVRQSEEWIKLRNHNISLLNGWFKTKKYKANESIDWGTEKAIIKKEIF